MEWFVRRFLKASLAWLATGATLGVAMAIVPALAPLRASHLHVNLLGFVAMMIFGVAYHVIPRFTGHPLHSNRLAGAHWWVANAALLSFATGLALRGYGVRGAAVLVALGGIGSAVGAYTFAYGLWRTIDGRAPRPRAMPASVQHAASAVQIGRRAS